MIDIDGNGLIYNIEQHRHFASPPLFFDFLPRTSLGTEISNDFISAPFETVLLVAVAVAAVVAADAGVGGAVDIFFRTLDSNSFLEILFNIPSVFAAATTSLIILIRFVL